jgi:two-component system, LytTR family, response regulator
MIRALIADDEPLAREALRDAIGGGAEIVAECANGAEAAEAMRRLQPDVAFLDVEMPGLDGLAAVRDVEHPPAVVFVTAYDEYAVEAFALEAVDYILKPVDEERVAEALRRVRARRPVLPHEQRFVVGSHGKLTVIGMKDVRYFEAAGNYVRLHTAAASPLMRGTLASIEKRLDPRRFVRVHRSFVVNVALIAELKTTRSGDYEVVLKGGGEVPMSRTFREAVLAHIGVRRP